VVLLVRVGSREVEPEVIGVGLMEEVLEAAEGLDLVELVLDEAVYSFDIGLEGVGTGRDGVVFGSGGLNGKSEGAVVLGVSGADELETAGRPFQARGGQSVCHGLRFR